MAKLPSLPPFPPHLQGDDKRTVILRAAMTMFLRDGYSETSMDAVTKEAGVSKATVYAHFESKQKLFETLVREGSETALGAFPMLARRGGPPAEELKAFFSPFLELLFRGGSAWNRMVIAESSRHPENARFFYSCTIARITAMVEQYFLALATEGVLSPGNESALAELFVSMILLGPLHRLLLLGPGSVDHQQSLKTGINLILDKCQPKRE
jgi:TetR/AcrR family transcriptional regulator, mexJK operon transcriptional repressor